MITARWACGLSAAICFAACAITGVWNAAWILGLLMVALAGLTSSRVQAYLEAELLAGDPAPTLSRLDELDRPCCLVDHSESDPCVDEQIDARDRRL